MDDRELLNKTNKRSQIKRASKKVNLKRKNLTRKVRKKNYPSRCNTRSAEPQPRRVTHKQEQTAAKQEKHGLDENYPVLTDEQIQKDFDLFYQDIFVHVAKLGQINDMAVCENENHLSGMFTSSSMIIMMQLGQICN